ncbi:hypothetical protein SAMN06295912_1195 [Sphingomonas laterariae]|uniref:Transglycosylase SLT domain-containing protein n=1 Tax=Edaphosphingomonas laterariae TaxID=861865 RepID=A0A239HSA8_9SPHN|nr:hypothetical protein [Sphingomonas laterariae]SNS84170.1 hypothetical protein SAMN06295912_1195 [Sphingomonas laterariae]
MTAPYLRGPGSIRTDRESVRAAIGRAAERTGANFTYLLNQAKSESGLNPFAKASTSSAGGLYQFIDQSWLGVLKQHGDKHGYGWAADAISWQGGRWRVDPSARQAVFNLRNDADASALMAGEFAQDNAEGLAAALGRTPTSGDLYFAHFLGLAGAKKFLKAAAASPDAPAASVFPREAAVNRSIFYNRAGEARSLAQVYALMAKKVDGPTEIAPAGNRMDTPLQMAALDMSAGVRMTGTPLAATPPATSADVRLVDLPASIAPQAPSRNGTTDAAPSDTMMALADRAGVNVLRPNPQFAALAYLLVASPFDTDGDRDERRAI